MSFDTVGNFQIWDQVIVETLEALLVVTWLFLVFGFLGAPRKTGQGRRGLTLQGECTLRIAMIACSIAPLLLLAWIGIAAMVGEPLASYGRELQSRLTPYCIPAMIALPLFYFWLRYYPTREDDLSLLHTGQAL